MDAPSHGTHNSHRQLRLPNETSRQSCLCGDSSPLEFQAQPRNDESGVEAILRVFSQSITFWERLKTCRPCLEAHTQRVLDMIESVISFLGNNIPDIPKKSVGAAQGDSQRSSDSGGSSNIIESRPQPFLQPHISPAVTGPPSPSPAVALENPPPMALGKFTLDGHQGVTLIRSIYRRMLLQIASVLDEMQQMEHNQRIQWKREPGDYLIPVLQLLEAIRS